MPLLSPYGVSKLAAENICYLYWKNIGMIVKFAGKEAIKDYQQVVKGDVRHTFADCPKAEKMLVYESDVSFEEDLKKESGMVKRTLQIVNI